MYLSSNAHKRYDRALVVDDHMEHVGNEHEHKPTDENPLLVDELSLK